MDNIPFQAEFRPELPNIYGTVDYREFREILIKIDEILIKSNLEYEIVSSTLKQFSENHALNFQEFSQTKKAHFHYQKIKHALRCNIARHLTGESYRLFSIRLADSTLFQWFTGISTFGYRKSLSKSTLERYEKYFDETFVSEKIRQWLAGLSDTNKSKNIGLQYSIDFEKTFTDSTCIKANIHFPVDWVLLRDAARSLLLAIKTIRTQGLKHRMMEPSQLLKQMNKLCIEMTHTRRKKESKKERKRILRAMKKVSRCIASHAVHYRELLNKEWKKTAWSIAQMQQVIRRIDAILEQLPKAIEQAHERIIGERMIASADKILSLYDKDVQVIVRGKAGNEVEFGQGLVLTEQMNGLIIDWELFSEQPSFDSQLLEPVVTRIKKNYGKIYSSCADRGFASKENDTLLKKENIINAICPKSPKQLRERLNDPIFVSLQTRRSQTEARIGIFKNVFLGKPLRSRITLNKRHAINWCVLTHNLWIVSRMVIADEHLLFKEAA